MKKRILSVLLVLVMLLSLLPISALATEERPPDPSVERLNELLNVKIECEGDYDDQHEDVYGFDDKTYNDLLPGSYSITRTGDKKCTVTIDSDPYIQDFSGLVYYNHVRENDEERYKTIKLKYEDGNWKLDKKESDTITVEFDVECTDPIVPEESGDPITVKVYVDGEQKKASEYVFFTYDREHTKDFSATAEGDIFTITYKYQTYDAADFSVNKLTSASAYAIQGVEAKVIGGSDGARTIFGNNSDVTLDNVKGGTTVKVYLRTLYAVQYDSGTPSGYVYITGRDVGSSTPANQYPDENDQSGTNVSWYNNGLNHRIKLDPVPTGSTGWYVNADGTGTKYDGQKQYPVSDFSSDDNRVIHFYSAKTCTVTYDANGGSGAPDAQTVLSGSDVTLTTTPALAHDPVNGVAVLFVGWSETRVQNILTKTDSLSDVTLVTGFTNLTENKTVYAVWGLDTNNSGEPDVQETKYRIVYNSNHGEAQGTVPTDSNVYIVGDVVTPVAPAPSTSGLSCDNHTLQGWALETTATTPLASYTVDDTDADGNNVIHLYGVWSDSYYTVTVTYKLEDEAGNVSDYGETNPDRSFEVEVGQSWAIDIGSNDPAKLTVGGVDYVYDRAAGSLTGEAAADVTLYYSKDVWSDGNSDSETGGDGMPDKYQVRVKYVSENNDMGTVSPTFEVITLRNGDGAFATTGTVTASGSIARAEDGYSFVNWTDPNGTEIADVGAELGAQTISNAEGGHTYTFTAYWELMTYTVTYNANAAEGEVTGMPKQNPQTKTHGQPLTLATDTPSRDGYVFTGWTTGVDGTGTKYAAGATYTDNKDLTLYAQWKNATYPVYVYAKILHGTTNVTSAAANETLIGPSGKLSAELNGNGAGWITIGKISDATEVEPKEGATAEKDPIVAQLNESNFKPYKGQDNFAGYVGSWNLNPVEKGAVDYVENYSTWTWHLDGTINAYTVTYNANGGTGADVTDGNYYLENASATVIDKPDSFTKPGYIFTGWSTNSGEDNSVDVSETITVTGDVTLYAVWEEENTELEVTKQVAMINGKPVEPAESYRVKVGDTITWTITVTNTGNVGQTLSLKDALPGVTVTPADVAARAVADTPESFWLAPNTSKIFMATYTTQLSDSGKTLVNEVVVSNGTSSKTAKAEPVYVEPALTVDKAIIAVNGVPVRTAPRVVEVGDTLTYIVTVTNNSNETLRDITVYDTLLDQWFNIGTLKAGESETITYTYTISAREAGTTVLNTAVAYVGNNRINADTAAVDVQHLYPIIPSTPNKPALNTQDHHAYIVGYPDGTVRPEGNITRAEAATIFFRLMTDESRDYYWSTYNSFSDVSRDAWYNNAVSTLASAGIMGGYPDGTFRPDQYITRAEISKIIATFAELSTSGRSFTDIEGHWAEGYIRLATGNGWLEGYPNGSFRPDQYITRAETMTMINRVLGRVPATEDRLLPYRVMLTFSDCQPGDWYYIAVQEATNSHSYERVDSGKAGDEQWIALRENRDWTKLEK